MKKAIFLGLFVALSMPFVTLAAFDTSLKYGASGPAVIELQEFLADQGVYSGPITGNFYSLTLKAVKAFQVKEGITPASGFFGPLSRLKAASMIDLTVSDADEQNQTGTVVPVQIPSAPMTYIAPTQPVNNPVQTPVVTDPIEVSFNELGNRDFIIISRFETATSMTVFLNNIYDGDTVTLTFNGNTKTQTFRGNNVQGQPLLYGSYQFPETTNLTPNTEYPYILKVQRGNKYAIKSGSFTTLKVY